MVSCDPLYLGIERDHVRLNAAALSSHSVVGQVEPRQRHAFMKAAPAVHEALGSACSFRHSSVTVAKVVADSGIERAADEVITNIPLLHRLVDLWP